jgi:hypothetical protein
MKILIQNDEEPAEGFLISLETTEFGIGNFSETSALGNSFALRTGTAAPPADKVDNYAEKEEGDDCQKCGSCHATFLMPLKRPEWIKCHKWVSLTK